LTKQIENEVYRIFNSSIASFTKDAEVDLFLSDLFTKAERINFTKRLAIAILLNKGHDWIVISDLLKVSFGTIAKIRSRIDSHGFRLFFAKQESNAKRRMFWDDLIKSYLAITHPEKYAKLGTAGIETVILKKKKTRLY